MKEGPNIVGIAALIGDHARAEVLTALMTGKALTATELADIASVTKQTMSGHLAKLVDAGLLTVEAQGRHRYYKISNEDVAYLIETLTGVAYRTGALRLRSSPKEPALRKARVCYNHLAGEMGVLLYDGLVMNGAFSFGNAGLELSSAGHRIFGEFGIDTYAVMAQKRVFCKSCLDWSERRHHLAGALGASLLDRIVDLGWATRIKGTRIMEFSVPGEKALRATFMPQQKADRTSASDAASANKTALLHND